MTLKTGALLGAAALVAGALGFAAPATAQATRTWVSGVGDDLNPCSRTAPCRTLGEALSKTAAGGEINCLDPATFGPFTITKSVSIICDGVPGGIHVEFDDTDQFAAIIVDAGATDSVLLSGINLRGNMRAGQGGIQLNSGGALHVRNSTIHSLGGSGVAILGASTVVLENIALNNVVEGVAVHPLSGGTVNFGISNVQMTNLVFNGISIASLPATASVKGTMSDSLIGASRYDPSHGISVEASSGQVRLSVERSLISGQELAGIHAEGSGAAITVSDSVISHNSVGLNAQNGAALVSFGGNILVGNTDNGSFTGTNLKK
ncbi:MULTISPECIES: right-handed parallel beta-helix repeat-containing protein [unclassified Sphingopyxis]|uniref:right-handed parallel beta-helix repeat-containing protein n=1 Tax=unclassified Sphingopyxis TaxID=2614943 RepID=UPI000737440E|nr:MULTISPECIES: right-handed parallel beta-helix repeat-containing protein [unclassified Sphingopyxis]KTE41414.1 hypothetical protein ATE62_05920 [Sphingopyxis sp. HIX]KTE84024.1 hypothetical protein ATE72_11175 [Sphingopyxis sp. HXXIV]